MTPRRVQQLTKEGVITAVKEGNANRYDLLPTIQRYIRYLTAKANGREPSKKDSEIEGRRLEAEADLKRSKADIAALQLSELEGTMHRSEDVEAVMTDLVYNIRSMLVPCRAVWPSTSPAQLHPPRRPKSSAQRSTRS